LLLTDEEQLDDN